MIMAKKKQTKTKQEKVWEKKVERPTQLGWVVSQF